MHLADAERAEHAEHAEQFTSSISTSATCKQEQRPVISPSKGSKIVSCTRWESSITEQIYAAELAVYLTEELHSTLILVSPCNSICRLSVQIARCCCGAQCHNLELRKNQ
jgi:hypothetical protein